MHFKIHFSLKIIFCITAFFFASCKSSTAPHDGTTIEQLYPMSYGNYWIYENQTYNPDGSITDDITQTTEITGTKNFNEHPGFLADFGNGSPPITFFYSGSDLYEVAPGSIDPTPFLILRYPMNSGEVFVVPDTANHNSNPDQQQIIFRGSNEPVTVSAGTFNCYHFSELFLSGTRALSDTSEVQELFFSAGIGLIENKIYSKDPRKLALASLYQLKSYRVE